MCKCLHVYVNIYIYLFIYLLIYLFYLFIYICIYIHMVHIAQTHYYMSLLVLKYMLRKKMLYVHIYMCVWCEVYMRVYIST